MADEPFKCKLAQVESLEDYFSVEYGPNGECRPCRLGPLASLYLGVLENASDADHAKVLSKAYETRDILTIAKTMDSIKLSAKDAVRQELETLDCFAQSYEGEE